VVVNWMPWGWSEPYYYNYGQNVYFQNNTVYYGSTPVATTDEYVRQAEAIATNLPETPPAEDSWMPLGVFAMVSDSEESTTDPTMFLQLAVSKEGMIAGTFKNVVSGTTASIEGMVDQESQRAAWTEVGKTRPLMECGFGNLTQDTAPALMHYADGTTQRWLLIRMEAPTDSPQPPSNSPGVRPPQ
jgi:hypothetical protein